MLTYQPRCRLQLTLDEATVERIPEALEEAFEAHGVDASFSDVETAAMVDGRYARRQVGVFSGS